MFSSSKPSEEKEAGMNFYSPPLEKARGTPYLYIP